MAVTLTSFLLLTQVGFFYSSKASCYILPVPLQMLYLTFSCRRRGFMLSNRVYVKRHFSLFRSPAFYFLILLLCGGDIKSNPGPATAEQIQELLNGQSTILSKLSQLTAEVTDVKTRLLSLESKLEKIDTNEVALANVEDRRQDHEALTSMIKEIDDLENRERSNNLLFYGLTDSDANETVARSQELIIAECTTKLELSSVSTERAHRLGKFCEGKTRPIIVRFNSLKPTKPCFQEHSSSRDRALLYLKTFPVLSVISERDYGILPNKTAKTA